MISWWWFVVLALWALLLFYVTAALLMRLAYFRGWYHGYEVGRESNREQDALAEEWYEFLDELP